MVLIRVTSVLRPSSILRLSRSGPLLVASFSTASSSAANLEAVERQYRSGSFLDRIKNGLSKAGKDLHKLEVDDLAAADELHTRGRESTLELSRYGEGKIHQGTKVLDVGCGIGGSARFLSKEYGCHVTGLDLTHEYIEVGNVLTEMVGLQDKVTLVQGRALEMPFEDETFDVAWTEHVQMNIEDKGAFYSQIYRILVPGGSLFFHDLFRGSNGGSLEFPVPWADTTDISHMATVEFARSAMESAGFQVSKWIVKDADSLGFFETMLAKVSKEGLPHLGVHLALGETAKTKIQNYVKNLASNRTTVIMAVLEKPSASL